jgi:hypothetical protein
MEKIILDCIKLIKEAEKEYNNLNDVKAIKYNKITSKLWNIEKEIIKKDEYKQLFKDILKQTSDDKYWKMHYDIAELLYLKDKYFALEIYKRYK